MMSFEANLDVYNVARIQEFTNPFPEMLPKKLAARIAGELNVLTNTTDYDYRHASNYDELQKIDETKAAKRLDDDYVELFARVKKHFGI